METLTYEEFLPVADYGFTEDPEVAMEMVRQLLATTDIPARPIAAEFLEFDSSNPHHACGYWNITVEFPPEFRNRVQGFLDQE